MMLGLIPTIKTNIKMNNEYIIINATAIQKRIDELEKQMQEHIQSAQKTGDYDFQFEDKLEELKEILSQSTPLIPEIEKAFNASKVTTGMNQRNQFAYKYKTSKDYITNLKLDI
jgi:hypothetical protein